ncbi:hypothetical protein [Piscinibacter sp. XHJ-5]|uniref:hypothetical protein n=1 Tax=Piscinibacter sp. XHJ-5 TaxID=3037797 RepID=UPI002452EC56|nr:hypothetical protein [Piscinibacter sp. XHJ-5]
MNETLKGSCVGASSGAEHTYILTIRPGGAEIWSARIYRDSRLVSVLARGLLERQLGDEDLAEHVRSLVVGFIDSLR